MIPEIEELSLSWVSKVGGKLLQVFLTFHKGGKIRTLELEGCTLTSQDGVFVGKWNSEEFFPEKQRMPVIGSWGLSGHRELQQTSC